MRQPLGGADETRTDVLFGDRHLRKEAVGILIREFSEEVLVEHVFPSVIDLHPAELVASEDQDQRAGGLAHQRLEPDISPKLALSELLVGVDGDHHARAADLGAGAPDVEAQVLRQMYRPS